MSRSKLAISLNNGLRAALDAYARDMSRRERHLVADGPLGIGTRLRSDRPCNVGV